MTYHLWGFFDSRRIVFTRGASMEQALQHASKSWERGSTISVMDYLPIHAKDLYDQNHAPGWLYRPPYYTGVTL